MNPTLISFLGNPPPKPQGGERTYALAHYRFPGDTVVHPGHVFAGALLARLRASGDALCTGTLSRPVDRDWWLNVRTLRNALAHGAYQGRRRFVLDALTNRASMESAMNAAFNWADDWRQYHEQRLGR